MRSIRRWEVINLNDYIYDIEAEQYSFLRVPKILLQHEEYQGLSTEAKLLYSLFLDRVGISIRNGWRDKQRRVYIIFTIEEIKNSLNCADKKAVQLLKELEERAGLIERKRQGLGKPNLIYVKSFIRTIDESGKVQFLNCENDNSGSEEMTIPDMSKAQCNNTNINKTECIYTDLSFLPDSEGKGMNEIKQYESFFRKQLEFSSLLEEYPHDRETLEGILELLVEACTSKRKTIRIAGDDKLAVIVRSRLMKLEASHIEYVLECMNDTTKDIRDIKQYLLTSLYNSVITKGPYYQVKVNHDFYGHQNQGG